MYLTIVSTTYSAAFFIPTILKQLGWTSVRAQVMTIPIYITSTVLGLIAAFLSDMVRHRYGFIIYGCLFATVGYIIMFNMTRVAVGARYFALFTFVTGGNTAQGAIMVWLNNNLAGHYKRAVGTGLQIGIGNIGGIVASNIYLSSQAPKYPLGFGLGFGLLCVCAFTATALLLLLMRENRLRDAGKRDHRYNLPEDERSNLGDDHPAFRFMY